MLCDESHRRHAVGVEAQAKRQSRCPKLCSPPAARSQQRHPPAPLPSTTEKRHPRTSLVRRAQTFLLRLVRGSSVKIAVASAGSGSVRPEIGRRGTSTAQAVSLTVAISSLSCVSGRISGQDTCTGEEEKAQGKENRGVP